MSRARWLAFGGTVALVGCNGAVASSGGHDVDGGGSAADSGQLADVGSPVDTGVAYDTGAIEEAGEALDSGAPEEASTDSSADDGGSAVCSRSGTFTCLTQQCDRSTQLCASNGGGCIAYDAALPGQELEAGTCGACPSCACIQPTLYPDCHCTEDDAGSIAISCAGCYGAPPVRLERIA